MSLLLIGPIIGFIIIIPIILINIHLNIISINGIPRKNASNNIDKYDSFSAMSRNKIDKYKYNLNI